MKTTAGAIVVLAAVMGSGCSQPTSIDVLYTTLIVDDAQISPTNHDGKPWCSDASVPLLSTEVIVGTSRFSTGKVASLSPSWAQPLMSLPADQYGQRGVFVQVLAACLDHTTRVGAAMLHPSLAAIRRQGLALASLGNVQRIRLRFPPTGGGELPEFDTSGIDYQPYDPTAQGGYVFDSPSSGGDASGDTGASDSGGVDNGAGDACGCSDGTGGDGSGSDGSGSDGSGSDGSGSDGSGSGDSRIRRQAGQAQVRRSPSASQASSASIQ